MYFSSLTISLKMIKKTKHLDLPHVCISLFQSIVHLYIYYIYIDIYVESYEEKIHRQTGLGIRWTHS